MTAAPASPCPRLRMIFHFKAGPVVTPFVIPARTQVVEIVTAGMVYFESEGVELELGCGAVFWHVPGEQTIYRTDPASPYECLALRFSTPHASHREVPRFFAISDHQRTRELCDELLRCYHDPTVSREELSRYVQARLLWEAHLGRRQPPASTLPAPLARVRHLIEEQFGRADLSVSSLAREADISEPHLHALFRRHLHQTPHQHLATRRIQEAKLLLTSSARTIKAISSECGFLNIETFYRVFGKQVGTSPHRFRQSHKRPF